jgi:Zn2+/Cd2+-exporting ATPase
MKRRPYSFNEFFASGQMESVSPMLTKNSRKWGQNLPMRISFVSAFCLILSAAFSFISPQASYLFLSFVFFISGTPALINAIEDLKHLEINIELLMTFAAFGSLFLGSPFEGALLLVLFDLSGALEKNVSAKAKSTLHDLHSLAPKEAVFIESDGHTIRKHVDTIKVGDHIYVEAGETVPLDSTLIEGDSSLNLAHITGESIPIHLKEKAEVPAGALNLDSGILLRVTKTSQQSTLSKIITMVTQAQASKAKVQRVIDRFGKPYSVAIMSLFALFTFTLPFLGLPLTGSEGSLYRALTFLIAASPCALIIAVPTAYLSALSSCAKKGIIIRSGQMFDALAKCETISFDKTGTLTQGLISFETIIPLNGEAKLTSLDKAVHIAYSLERGISHPIAKSITLFAEKKGLSPMPVRHFIAHSGRGVEGTLNGCSVKIGTSAFVGVEEAANDELHLGKMRAYLKIDKALFLLTFQDDLRNDASQTISQLTHLGLKTQLISGDSQSNVTEVAKKVGIDEFFYALKPEEKLDIVSKHSLTGHAMVGDGMNDAPSLAKSTVGIAMGKVGSALAIESSDVILMKEDLSSIPWLFKKARGTKRIITQNLFLSLSLIIIASSLAMIGSIPLWLGVVLHEGGTLLVGLNSLRLLKK